MVPADSGRVPLAPPYSGYHYQNLSLPVRDSHPLRSAFPDCSSSNKFQISWSYNPTTAETIVVWASPRSLATTCGITFVLFSSRYLDVSVPWVRLPEGISRLHRDGLPHSDIRGSQLIATPRSLSQLITSFFASESLGIHHAPLTTSFRLFSHSLCMHPKNASLL